MKSDIKKQVDDCFEDITLGETIGEGAMKELVTDEPDFDILWNEWIGKKKVEKKDDKKCNMKTGPQRRVGQQ